MNSLDQLRVILAHDWLTGMRGGEKVLEVLCRRWPGAPLYTLLHRPGSVSAAIEACAIQTSFLQKLPAVHRYYRYLLPVMPLAATRWRLPPCDLVVSSSHCVIKGLTVPDGVPHVCYCHTPMRYAWHMRASYFRDQSHFGLKSRLADVILHRLREWDRRTAKNVSYFIANSKVVQRRILDCYGRSSEVIHPPVDTDFYQPAPVPREDYYLVMSALAPYKRLDLAIDACAALRRKLVIIGTGQEEKKLRRRAGSNVTFLGWQSDEVIRSHYQRCRALLFPGEEDFGIVPVEAQACGAPVIAFGRGGATETVVPLERNTEPTGIWFEEQTSESLGDAIVSLEKNSGALDPSAIRRHAEKFNSARFVRELFAFLESVIERKDLRRAA